MKKGDKRGSYTKNAATKKKSKPTAASTAVLAAFIVRGTDQAPPDGHDSLGRVNTVGYGSYAEIGVSPFEAQDFASGF